MLAVCISPVVGEGSTRSQQGKAPQALPHSGKLPLAMVY